MMIHDIELRKKVQKNSSCETTSVHILKDIFCEMSQGCPCW